MAKLTEFRTDTRAINDGVWLRVGPAYGDLEIFTRGFTDDFIDAQEARLDRAAVTYGNDRTKIPNAERRSINASLLEDFLVIDIRNLTEGDDNKVVSVGDFRSMLYEPQWSMLARACWDVASRVSTLSAEKLKATAGNSASSSASS